MMVPSPLNDEPLLGTPARSGGALLSTNSSYSPRSEASFYRPPSPSMEVKISRIAMIRRLSLQFVDAELERAYTEDLLRRKLRTIRVHGCFLSVVCGLLASLLFVPALELPTSRGGPPVLLILLAAAQVAWSFHRSFRRYLRVSAALLGAGVVGWVMFFVERILQEGVGESNTDNESRTNTIVFLFAVASPVISWLPLVPGLHLHHAFFFMLVLEAYLFSMTWVILESLSWASVALLLTLPYCVIHMLFGQSVHGSDRRAFLVQQFLTKENVEIQLKAEESNSVFPGFFSLFRSSSVPSWSIASSSVQLGDVIGEGAYGVVRRGVWRGSEVAVKQLRRKIDEQHELAQFCSEISIMLELRHPNVLLIMAACVEPENMFFLTEYIDRGTLFSLLHDPAISFSLPLSLSLCLSAARGINYLHNANPPIVHRDIKSLNILVDSKWNVKVADFGLTRFRDSSVSRGDRLTIGSVLWTAPEVLSAFLREKSVRRHRLQNLRSSRLESPVDVQEEPEEDGEAHVFTEKADVYSFAIVMWEVFTRSEPFSDLDDLNTIATRVVEENLRPTITSTIPDNVSELIQACWHREPSLRPNFTSIVGFLGSATSANRGSVRISSPFS
eukprot:TRINITY_DN2942_c0_g1_i3.p1 TRINITY_DN2942_c0_g1~~TRINITY_DN2942_c0_g1_i3.p1  ORF type:complete len:632 (+),score=156.57 TRINITY_DN2942_c0_g1_i3:54-1898(+)